jgi:menaquinone-9 beta-reductase
VAHEAALACGKHDLRGRARPEGDQNDLIGLKVHFELRAGAAAQQRDTVLIGLFPGGYAGLEPIEDGRFNLCLVVRERRYAALGRDWARLLAEVGRAAPAIGKALRGASPVTARPLAVAKIPYGYVVRENEADGCWRLGDQAAVIPSFAGEGMAIALRSARLAAATMLAGETAAAYQRSLGANVAGRVRLATAVSRGLVHAPLQGLAAGLAQMAPRSMAALATATRIPGTARA